MMYEVKEFMMVLHGAVIFKLNRGGEKEVNPN
jgi:hypothetical protein